MSRVRGGKGGIVSAEDGYTEPDFEGTLLAERLGALSPAAALEDGPLVMPQDEFDALRKAAAALGMELRPAASPVPSAEATGSPEPVTEAAVDAALAVDAEWVRAHPCGPTWTRPPREQVRRLIAAEWQRAEAAEAKLAAITTRCREHLERAGAERGSVCCPHFAEEILAITGSEEEARDA